MQSGIDMALDHTYSSVYFAEGNWQQPTATFETRSSDATYSNCHYAELQPVPADVCPGVDISLEGLSYDLKSSSVKPEFTHEEWLVKSDNYYEHVETHLDVSFGEQLIQANVETVPEFSIQMQPIIILGTVVGTVIAHPMSVDFAESSNNSMLNQFTSHIAHKVGDIKKLPLKKSKKNEAKKSPTELASIQTLEHFQKLNKMIFPQKLWHLASNPDFEAIRWSRDGTVIEINEILLKPYLSRLTRSSKFSSFLRQLHLYKFRKTQNFNSKKIPDRTVIKYRRKGFSREGWYSNILL